MSRTARTAGTTRVTSGARRPFAAALVAPAIVLALGACSTGSAEAGATAPTRLTQTSTGGGAGTSTGSSTAATSTGAPTSGTAAATDPRLAKVATVNRKLTGSLFTVVETMKKLQTDNTLSELRQKLGESTTASREALKRTRDAAYPSETRNCTTARANAAATAARASEGSAVRGQITSRVALLNSHLGALKTATGVVATDRDALAAALKGLPDPPATVPATEVTAALSQAATRRTEMLAAIAAVEKTNAEAGSSLSKFVSQSRAIVSDACG